MSKWVSCEGNESVREMSVFGVREMSVNVRGTEQRRWGGWQEIFCSHQKHSDCGVRDRTAKLRVHRGPLLKIYYNYLRRSYRCPR